MKVVTSLLNSIATGDKITIYKLRHLMGYIDRKPDIYLQSVKQAIRDKKPKMADFDTKTLNNILRSRLTASEDYIKKGVDKDHAEQFALLNTIFVKDIQENKIGEFTVHVPIYQITYGKNEVGFSFYLSSNKPVFI